VFDIVESSMRIMVDGDGIRVAFSKDLQREPLSLYSGFETRGHGCTSVMGPTLPFIPQALPP